jgi:hypothetical protein
MRAFDDLPRLAELSLKAARQARTLALSVVRTVAETALRRRSSDQISGWTRHWEPPSSRPVGEPPPPPGAPRRPVATTPAAPPVGATPGPPPPPAAVPPPPPPPAPAVSAPEPAAEPQHVDSDAVVVAESADAGAPDGVGAEVHVAEPWDGYSDLNVKDITKELATASAATLAVVRLYESAHRNRRTVLAAVDRRLAATDR